MMKATLSLAAIITLVFIFQLVEPGLTGQFTLVSRDVAERPWIIITSMFLHADIVHLMYNLLGLVMFGLILENEIGTRKFLMTFFASGIIAGFAATFFYESALGASGAIFGIIGVVAVLRPMMTVWAYSIPMPMFLAAAAWAIGDLIWLRLPGNVANAAHLGGLAAGLIAGFIMRKPQPKQGKQPPAVSKREIEGWENQYMLGKFK